MLSCGGRRSELLGARCLAMESGRGLTGTHRLTQGFVSNPGQASHKAGLWSDGSATATQTGEGFEPSHPGLGSHAPVTLGKALHSLSLSFPICKM